MSKTAAFPVYTTQQLRDMVSEPFVNDATKAKMQAEIDRRNAAHDLDEYRRDQEDHNPCVETYDY